MNCAPRSMPLSAFPRSSRARLFGKLGNAQYLDYSKDILGSGRHLLAVINDVLDLVKSESGKMSLKSQELDMCAMLQECVSMMREQCRQAGLTLTVRGLEWPLPLSGEPAKLRRDLSQPAFQCRQIHRSRRRDHAWRPRRRPTPSAS